MSFINDSSAILGFDELGRFLGRSPKSLRTAASIGLLPIQSEIRAGVRCFDGRSAALLGQILNGSGVEGEA